MSIFQLFKHSSSLLVNFCDKREQSQTCLSYAERSKNHEVILRNDKSNKEAKQKSRSNFGHKSNEEIMTKATKQLIIQKDS